MSEFVPFEIAKKLKEKGFKEKCLTYYDVIDNVGLLYNTQYTNDLSPCQYTDLLQSHNTDVSVYQSDDSEYCVDAPTISQVLKWLRDEKCIHIEIYTNASGYDYNISDTPKLGGTARYWVDYAGTNDSGCWDSYEECVLAGIEYVLDNLI